MNVVYVMGERVAEQVDDDKYLDKIVATEIDDESFSLLFNFEQSVEGIFFLF